METLKRGNDLPIKSPWDAATDTQLALVHATMLADTALHEAAHAVIAVLCGYPIDWAILTPENLESLGAVHFAFAEKEIGYDCVDEYCAALLRSALVSLAGHAVLGAFPPSCFADDDMTDAADDLRSYWLAITSSAPTELHLSGMLNDAFRCARSLVASERVAVEAVAAALLSRKRLDAQEINQLVAAAGRGLDLQRVLRAMRARIGIRAVHERV